MTIINTNSISGINSITAQGASGVAFYDSSGSSERLRIESGGRLLAGLNASVDSNSTLQVEGRNTITAIRYSAATGNSGSKLELSRSASNTVGTTAAVSATDELGEIRFRGASTGSAFNTGAVISAVITSGTISASSFPTDLLFKTTNNGAASATERLRITSGGNIGINKTAPADRLHVGGKIRFGNNNSYYGVIEHEEGVTGANIYTSNDSGGHIFKKSATTQMTIDNTGNVNITDGNLVIGTSGHGIDFSVTGDGSGTSSVNELLDDYEEGTWTPTGTSDLQTTSGERYIKVGRLVTVTCRLAFLTNSSSTRCDIGGLPYAPDGDISNSAMGSAVGETDYTGSDRPFAGIEIGGLIRFRINGGTSMTYANWSGKSVRMSLTYFSST